MKVLIVEIVRDFCALSLICFLTACSAAGGQNAQLTGTAVARAVELTANAVAQQQTAAALPTDTLDTASHGHPDTHGYPAPERDAYADGNTHENTQVNQYS